MNFTIFFLFASIAIVAAYHRDFDATSFDSNSRLLRELQMEMEMEEAMDKPMSRPRRVPAPGDSRACGRKLVMFVLSVCGESCNPKHGADIATQCCGQQCSEDFIKTACCPQ